VVLLEVVYMLTETSEVLALLREASVQATPQHALVGLEQLVKDMLAVTQTPQQLTTTLEVEVLDRLVGIQVPEALVVLGK
jgi:hypothetical protein